MAEVTQNPFAWSGGASRYRAGRMFHHPRALSRIMDVVGAQPLPRALDIACGTGLSTVALGEWSGFVVGIDPVEDMIELAPRDDGVAYALGAAEHLPFHSATFSLVTASSGVHWFNQASFFDEAARVLALDGWLAIYDHFFMGSVDDPTMSTWLEEVYGSRYPPPPRGEQADRSMTSKHFTENEVLEYDDPITLSQDQLVAYLLSHSNTIVASGDRGEDPRATEEWLRAETAFLYQARGDHSFLYRGIARCLRRS